MKQLRSTLLILVLVAFLLTGFPKATIRIDSYVRDRELHETLFVPAGTVVEVGTRTFWRNEYIELCYIHWHDPWGIGHGGMIWCWKLDPLTDEEN